MRKTINLLTLAMLLILASCAPEEKAVVTNHSDASSTTELNVPNGFDWKATRDAEVVLTPQKNGVLLVQDERGAVYHKAFVKSGESYSAKFHVPTGKRELHIFFEGGTESFNPGSGTFYSSLK